MGHMALYYSQRIRLSYGSSLPSSRRNKKKLAREIIGRLITDKALGDRRRFIRILRKDSRADKLWNLLKLRPDLKIELVGLSSEKFKAALQEMFAGVTFDKILRRIGAGARKIIIEENPEGGNEATFIFRTTSAY